MTDIDACTLQAKRAKKQRAKQLRQERLARTVQVDT